LTNLLKHAGSNIHEVNLENYKSNKLLDY